MRNALMIVNQVARCPACIYGETMSADCWKGRTARPETLSYEDEVRLVRERDLLIGWVHLHPDANRKLARALADEILRRPTPRSTAGNRIDG